MSGNSDNRRRAFADVVSLDAWHQSFDDTHPKVDLHADVVFGTARLGGELESPVRFRLSVKQAEVIIVIPDSEPVLVETSSVAREGPEARGRLTETLEQASHAHAEGRVAASTGMTGLAASGSASASIEGSIATKKKVEMSGWLMAVTSSKTEEGHYRWIIKPSASQCLEGRPWDANYQPRLKIIDKRKDRSKGIPPAVRVEVRCRREDLLIDDLQVKDAKLWDQVKDRIGFKNKMAAAISYIRDRLSEEGLEIRNIEDIFGSVTLASVTAEAL
jgi:hypothetical protein